MTSNSRTYVFVDCEAVGLAPGLPGSELTEFGAVEFKSRKSFHGVLWDSVPSEANPAIPKIVGQGYDRLVVAMHFELWLQQFDGRPIFVSDNNGYDFMWLAHMFGSTIGYNPFGHSSRRIGDIYSGLVSGWNAADPGLTEKLKLAGQSGYKKWRVTPHDHNPVHDALGNVEAFQRMLDEFGLEL